MLCNYGGVLFTSSFDPVLYGTTVTRMRRDEASPECYLIFKFMSKILFQVQIFKTQESFSKLTIQMAGVKFEQVCNREREREVNATQILCDLYIDIVPTVLLNNI